MAPYKAPLHPDEEIKHLQIMLPRYKPNKQIDPMRNVTPEDIRTSEIELFKDDVQLMLKENSKEVNKSDDKLEKSTDVSPKTGNQNVKVDRLTRFVDKSPKYSNQNIYICSPDMYHKESKLKNKQTKFDGSGVKLSNEFFKFGNQSSQFDKECATFVNDVSKISKDFDTNINELNEFNNEPKLDEFSSTLGVCGKKSDEFGNESLEQNKSRDYLSDYSKADGVSKNNYKSGDERVTVSCTKGTTFITVDNSGDKESIVTKLSINENICEDVEVEKPKAVVSCKRSLSQGEL